MVLCVYFVVFALAGKVNEVAEPDFQQEEIIPGWKEELRQIDEEIKEATDLKNRYLAAARRAEDEGMRWQFMQNQKQEAKRAFQRAADKKKAAEMLDARIKVLQARRAQIMEEYPNG
jgi:hypothetical protein